MQNQRKQQRRTPDPNTKCPACHGKLFGSALGSLSQARANASTLRLQADERGRLFRTCPWCHRSVYFDDRRTLTGHHESHGAQERRRA